MYHTLACSTLDLLFTLSDMNLYLTPPDFPFFLVAFLDVENEYRFIIACPVYNVIRRKYLKPNYIRLRACSNSFS